MSLKLMQLLSVEEMFLESTRRFEIIFIPGVHFSDIVLLSTNPSGNGVQREYAPSWNPKLNYVH